MATGERVGKDTGADVSGRTVTPQGRPVARTLQARLGASTDLFDYIPSQYHAGIQANTSSVDVSGWIQDALDEAGTTTDGLAHAVTAPNGTFVLGSEIVVPSRVRVVGQGVRASLFKLANGFSGTYAVRLGQAGIVAAFNSVIENLTVNCNDVAGTTGIYTSSANEGCGTKHVLVTRYRSYGINVEEADSGIPDHFLFFDTEVYASGSATGSVGFRYSGLRNGGQIVRMTVSGNTPIADQAAGVQIAGTGAGGGSVHVVGLNVERHAEGVVYEANGGGTLVGAALHLSGTTLVRIKAGARPVNLSSLWRATGTNTVVNDIIGATGTITTARVPSYVAAESAEGYQVFTSAGASATHGNVHSDGTNSARWLIRSAATAGGARRSFVDMLDGNGTGWRLRSAPDGTDAPVQLLPVTAGVVGSTVFQVTNGGVVTVNGVTQRSGAGSPEGVVTAVPGSLFFRTDGGAGATFYVKETGTGNTGWIAK